MDKFGERIKRLRIEKGLMMKEVAEAVDITAPSITMYESGQRHPEYKTLIKLCKLFDVSADYLLGLSDDPTPPRRGVG